MIAAVDIEAKVVWGYGHTRMTALEDARRCLAEKPQFVVNLGRLALVPMRDDADLGEDGYGLFKYCLIKKDTGSPQQRLF